MVRKDIITMSRREIRRVGIIQRVEEKRITQCEAGKILGVSGRQVIRLTQKYREQGEEGLIHGLRGQPSNRGIDPQRKKTIVALYREQYTGFGPTLASEKLEERNHLTIHPETLRRWLREEKIEYPQRRGKQHRRWRERKACYGEMVQIDGSTHAWLDDRSPKMVLMAYIDDATGQVYGRFYAYEGTLPAMDSFWRYSQRSGLPQSIYLDRHETYKSPSKLTLEDELAGREQSESQFQRAMRELDVQVKYAYSPQAKGRIERLFKTLQDRLIKEMRLEGIASMEEANLFLENYLPHYNQRFSHPPSNPTNLHRQPPRPRNLFSILCIQQSRALRLDGTFRYQNHWYQIQGSLRPKTLQIQEWIDGTLHVFQDSKELPYRKIQGPLPPKSSPVTPPWRVRVFTPPAPHHPWRNRPRAKAKIKAMALP